MKVDKIRDMAIECVDKMVKEGIVKDCIDTDDTTEFDIQDIIVEQIELDIQDIIVEQESNTMKQIIKSLRELQSRVDKNTLCNLNKDFEKVIDQIKKEGSKKDEQ